MKRNNTIKPTPSAQLIALVSIALAVVWAAGAFADDSLPPMDESKPVYQFTWGGPPPLDMTFFGAMQEVEPKEKIVHAESKKSAGMWQKLAKGTALGAVVLTFVWYFSNKKQIAGAAVLSLLISFGCTIMAEIVSKAWMIALGGAIVAAVIAVGFLIQNKSFSAWWKSRKQFRSPTKKKQGRDAQTPNQGA